MKRAILAMLLLCGCGLWMGQIPLGGITKAGTSGPNLTLLQHPNGQWSSGSTISITLTQSITAGSILIFGDQTNVTSARISSINVGGTLVACGASSSCFNSAAGHGMDTTDGGWVLSASATAGPVVVTYTGGLTAGRIEMREYSCTGGTASADVQGYRDSSTDTSPYNGVTLSPTGTNDVIVQWTNTAGNSPTSVSAPYGNFDITGAGEQFAMVDRLNTSSGTAPSFTAAGNSGGSTSAAIAVKCQ